MTDIIIPSEGIKKDFENFLDTSNNSRIFFSGPFGIGKTYFLKSFFENQEKYDVYHISPVNYQVLANEDIIELIKYDLLVELFEKDQNIFKNKEVLGIKESSLLFYSWVKESYSTNQILMSALTVGETLSTSSPDPLVNILGKLGRPLKNLLIIDKNFQSFKKEYKAGEKGLIEKYENAIRSKNSLETDYISSLIKDKILENKKERASVLVLDDMDRIDPDHIFRVLNILSAHFERDKENKFGFDKIIFVADFMNLKHIFHHKYGPNTDFSGYMDKFFTISPYYFDNKKAVLNKVSEILKSIKYEEPGLKDAIGDNGFIKLFLTNIFTNAINAEIINLRQLLKANYYQLAELKKGGYYSAQYEDEFSRMLDLAIKISIHTFSSTSVFLEKIKQIKTDGVRYGERIPYDRYTKSMLKSIGFDIEQSEPLDLTWGGYRLIKSKNGFKHFDVAGAETQENLFYDVLIEYVKAKKYIKDGISG